MRFLEHAVLASWKNLIQFPQYKIACGYDCRRVLKHVSKSPRHSSCRTQQSQVSCRLDLHETTRVVDLS